MMGWLTVKNRAGAFLGFGGQALYVPFAGYGGDLMIMIASFLGMMGGFHNHNDASFHGHRYGIFVSVCVTFFVPYADVFCLSQTALFSLLACAGYSVVIGLGLSWGVAAVITYVQTMFVLAFSVRYCSLSLLCSFLCSHR